MRIDAEPGELPARRRKKEKSSSREGVAKRKELHREGETLTTGK